MQIAINHLTRMTEGHVCVAGVDLETGRHVRPVLTWGHLTPAVLARHQGPFDIGHVVELGGPVPWPKRPHVEDHLFDPSTTVLLERMDAEAFWALLVRTGKARLSDIFGRDLRHAKDSPACCVDLGKGIASLGCLVPRRKPRLACQRHGQKTSLRMEIDDGQVTAWAPVTDLRLYQDDHVTPDLEAVERIRRRLAAPGAVILSVGLTREFASPHEPRGVHWLQVNNVHLESEPARPLG